MATYALKPRHSVPSVLPRHPDVPDGKVASTPLVGAGHNAALRMAAMRAPTRKGHSRCLRPNSSNPMDRRAQTK